MSILLLGGPGSRGNPLPWLAVVLATFGLVALLRDHRPGGVSESSLACDPAGGAACDGVRVDDSGGPDLSGSGAARSGAGGPVLRAAEACVGVGYLCADLSDADRIRLQRWTGVNGTLVVHVPLPEFEEPEYARQLRSAAATGIRAWDGHPFRISIDERGTRDPRFSVEWRRVLGGSRLGMARTQWTPGEGRGVLALELATRNPFDPDALLDATQVRLTAAHEMGHVLGLPHSDAPRDVMYPTNTAMSLSAQDYRTMEALYGLPDGTEIVR